MATMFKTPPTATRTPETADPVVERGNGAFIRATPVVVPTKGETLHRLGLIGIIGLRLALGFEFLWAFFDKTFGLGYATPAARAWVNGGSPTRGFLSGVNAGPFQDVFRSMAGSSLVDWVFMLGLLGVGVALILGVAVRAGAITGAVMLALMYLAVWVPATMAAGQPTGSVNPVVDDHIVGIFGMIMVAALATRGTGYLGRKWAALPIVQRHSSLV